MRLTFNKTLSVIEKQEVIQAIQGWFTKDVTFNLGTNLGRSYTFTVDGATVQIIQGVISPHVGQEVIQAISLESASYQLNNYSHAVVDRTMPTNSQSYTLIFQNHSTNDWSFICFQNQPNGLPKGYFSLAWFAFPVASDTEITFKWSIDYSFVWSQTGELKPGIEFAASQNLSADLTSKNAVTFTRLNNKAFKFINLTKGDGGQMTIVQDETIPGQTASIGIGMSNCPSYVVQAQPNINVNFVPEPHYYIAFGQSINEGEVLNISQFSQIQEIVFPPNKFTATAVLKDDNTWATPIYS